MNLLYRLAVTGLALLLAACSTEEAVETMADQFASKEVRSKAETVADLVLSKNEAGLRAEFADLSVGESFDDQLRHMLSFVPDGDVTSRVFSNFTVSTKTTSGESGSSYDFEYQYLVGSDWIWLKIIVEEQSDRVFVSNINVTPLDDDLRKINNFDLSDASPREFAFLLAMIANPVLIIFTFVTAFRMRKKLLKPKRWLFFILIGFGALELNWTSGEMVFQFVHVGLLGAGFVKTGVTGAWFLTLYFPLGALLFWLYRKTGRLGLKDEVTDADNDGLAAG